MEKKDNSGALFKNERKTKDTHPSHTGKVTIAGVEYWISAWVKEGSKGRYFSLSFKPKEERQEQPAKQSQPVFDDNSEIPF